MLSLSVRSLIKRKLTTLAKKKTTWLFAVGDMNIMVVLCIYSVVGSWEVVSFSIFKVEKVFLVFFKKFVFWFKLKLTINFFVIFYLFKC